MVTASEIMSYLESIAPSESAMSFDNVGLLIGDPQAGSELVLLALDLTREVLDEALRRGAGIIVTHHPVIFSPLKRIDVRSIQYAAVSSGITVISAHTNLDIAPGGVNDTLAEKLGVKSENGTDSECMLVGETENEQDVREFALRIKEVLGCRGLRYTEGRGTVRRIAVACGSGGSSIFSAAKEGADALVTGEIKHHELLFAAEKKIAVFDLGHFCSEDMIIPELAGRLSDALPGAEFVQAESDIDYVYYL